MEETRKKLIELEKKKIHRLRFLVDLTTSTLYQEQNLSLTEARQIVQNVRRVILRMFPDKEETFDLILLPRFERILYERWGTGLSDSVH